MTVSIEEMTAEIIRYLDLLYDGAPNDAWLIVSWPDPIATTNGKAPPMLSAWYRLRQRRLAVQRIAGLAPNHDVYLNLGLRRPSCREGRTRRGTRGDVYVIPGLWVDADHSGGVHAAANLPSLEELLSFLRSLPFAWSLLIDSTGGIHAYLLFQEPWVFETPTDTERAQRLLQRFQYTIRVQAQAHGWHVDSTGDLARVLRPGGSYNHKRGQLGYVHILEQTPTRYTPAELEEASWLLPLPQGAAGRAEPDEEAPSAQMEPIVAGCAWMRHCRDDAATLDEPQWYAMLSILGRCEDGDRLAQEWSRAYPNYSEEETGAKLTHALGAGPRTCANIATMTAMHYCQGCPSWQRIASPIRLGYARRGPRSERQHSDTDLPQWPILDPRALHGLVGEVVRVIRPHTEADDVALLVQTLLAFGNVIGRRPHCIAEADYHALNEFAVLVGTTAKGRKGSSAGHVQRLFARVDPVWVEDRIQGGLSSGEGLLWAVRDPIVKSEAIREKGRPTGEYQEVTVDIGVSDKRLLILEAELAATLRVLGRDGNTLSAIIRQAWDDGRLRVLTKNNPSQATGAHISLVGHITRDELLRYLDSTEAGNGYGNRHLWCCVRRSKTLPAGGSLDDEALNDLVKRLRGAIEAAAKVDVITRDEEARAIWREVYPELSEGKPGLLGAMISRGEAHVLRLSGIYALLDCSAVVKAEHLLVALALWEYCEDSARFIFGASLGDPLADEILRVLRANDQGQTRTEISNHFGRNKSSAQITRALQVLVEQGLATCEKQETEGRSAEVWKATGATKETK